MSCRVPIVPPIPSSTGMDVAGTGQDDGGSVSTTSTFVPVACPVVPSTGSGPVRTKATSANETCRKEGKSVSLFMTRVVYTTMFEGLDV
jgi:hypothetical protein